MRLRITSVTVALLTFFSAFVSAQTPVANPRFALVIGNSDYQGMPKLKNPVNDATDLAAALKGLGFKATLLTNASRKAMNQAIVAFREALAQDRQSEGMFFYAGHGVQSRGVNYLIPVSADIQAESDLEDESVSVQRVLGSLEEARNRVNLVILDACRDNPLPSSLRNSTRGLAVVASAPPETLVLYSTAAGQTAADGEGRNSPFSRALLAHLADFGDVTQTVKVVTGEVKKATGGQQTPYVYMGLSVDFSLNPTTSASGTATAASPTPVRKPTVTIEKAYGSLTVDVQMKGSLYLNGALMGDLSPGSTARMDNIEAGHVNLAMQYADGRRESKEIEVKGNSVAGVSFAYVEQRSKSKPLPSASRPQETQHEGVLPSLSTLPNATIHMNGDFGEWDNVMPAFMISTTEKGNRTFDKVYLATDESNLYMRFHITDDTASTFFHPYNFDASHNSSYGLDLAKGDKHLVLSVDYDTNPRNSHWSVQVSGLVSGTWKSLSRSRKDYAMRGSSLEARFPLSVIKEFLGPLAAGESYEVTARSGYNDSQWKWVEEETHRTEAKHFVF